MKLLQSIAIAFAFALSFTLLDAMNPSARTRAIRASRSNIRGMSQIEMQQLASAKQAVESTLAKLDAGTLSLTPSGVKGLEDKIAFIKNNDPRTAAQYTERLAIHRRSLPSGIVPPTIVPEAAAPISLPVIKDVSEAAGTKLKPEIGILGKPTTTVHEPAPEAPAPAAELLPIYIPALNKEEINKQIIDSLSKFGLELDELKEFISDINFTSLDSTTNLPIYKDMIQNDGLSNKIMQWYNSIKENIPKLGIIRGDISGPVNELDRKLNRIITSFQNKVNGFKGQNNVYSKDYFTITTFIFKTLRHLNAILSAIHNDIGGAQERSPDSNRKLRAINETLQTQAGNTNFYKEPAISQDVQSFRALK